MFNFLYTYVKDTFVCENRRLCQNNQIMSVHCQKKVKLIKLMIHVCLKLKSGLEIKEMLTLEIYNCQSFDKIFKRKLLVKPPLATCPPIKAKSLEKP